MRLAAGVLAGHRSVGPIPRGLITHFAAGLLAVSGEAVSFSRAYVIAAQSGQLELSGQPADLLVRRLAVAAGVLAVVGQPVRFLHDIVAVFDAGELASRGKRSRSTAARISWLAAAGAAAGRAGAAAGRQAHPIGNGQLRRLGSAGCDADQDAGGCGSDRGPRGGGWLTAQRTLIAASAALSVAGQSATLRAQPRASCLGLVYSQ